MSFSLEQSSRRRVAVELPITITITITIAIAIVLVGFDRIVVGRAGVYRPHFRGCSADSGKKMADFWFVVGLTDPTPRPTSVLVTDPTTLRQEQTTHGYRPRP